MLGFRNYLLLASIIFLLLVIVLFVLIISVNYQYSQNSQQTKDRMILLSILHTASPAIITGGRNIAFETGNALSNAPASYINMLSCCEADESIASRILYGQVTCKIIRR